MDTLISPRGALVTCGISTLQKTQSLHHYSCHLRAQVVWTRVSEHKDITDPRTSPTTQSRAEEIKCHEVGILQTTLLKAFKKRENSAQPWQVILFPETTHFSSIHKLSWQLFFLYLWKSCYIQVFREFTIFLILSPLTCHWHKSSLFILKILHTTLLGSHEDFQGHQ